MIRLRYIAVLLLPLAAVAPFWAEDKKPADQKDGFVPMFNGKDLTGWVNVNCAPSTFYWKDGEAITTGHPTGYLRTEKQYENFIAEFDWMHINKDKEGNSGFFVWADPLPAVGTGYTRGIEVQVLVNHEKKDYYTSQGDLFSIWGATCKPDRPHPHGWMRCLPSENRQKGGGEWNHFKVIANDGTLKLHVNGKEVSGLSECKPCKGYLGLESEGAECHFKNLVIKELPSTNPKPDEVADVARGHKQLFTGLDLSGWKVDEELKTHWKPNDWTLKADGKGEALKTEKEFGDAEFIIDFQFLKDADQPCLFILREKADLRITLSISPNGAYQIRAGGKGPFIFNDGKIENIKMAGEWNRLQVVINEGSIKPGINGSDLKRLPTVQGFEKGFFGLQPQGPMTFGNLFVLEQKK